MTHKTIHDADALLLYRVGPVYCCSPTFPVESVMMPPNMSHPPGTSTAEPGVFKTAQGIVKAIDLRKRFGVDENDWERPGRIVIVEVVGGHAGIWVDEIVDVIQSPSKGWGDVPACIPRDVFSRTLLLNNEIQLYADFEKIYNFREVGYLRKHIENLKAKENNKALEDDEDLSQQADEKHVISVNEKDFSKDIESSQANDKVNNHHEIKILETKYNNVHDEIELSAGELDSVELKKERLDKKIDSFEAKPESRADFNKDISEPISPVDDVHYTNKNKSISSAASARHIDMKQMQPDSGEAGIEAGLLISSSPVVKDGHEKESHLNESSYFLYIVVSVAVIAIGAFTMNIMAPSVNEDSSLIANTMSSKNNKTDGDVVEFKRNDIHEPAVNEDLVSNKIESYYADIKKDEEGMVIVLTRPVEPEKIIDEKENKPEAAEIKDGKEILDLKNDAENQKTNSIVNKLEKEKLKAEKNNNLMQGKIIIHKVVKGDTLWHIARRYIHDPFRYPELARLSHIKNPDLIYPGDLVKIIYKNDSK